MSLFRQMLMVIFTLLLMAFVGAFYFTQHYSRAFAQNTLQHHAQETADLLSRTLVMPLSTNNSLAVKNTVDPFFKDGRYQQIAINDVKGKLIYQKQGEDQKAYIPHWFIKGFSLQLSPAVSNSIIDGRYVGTITVTSNPEFALMMLWKNCQGVLIWILIMAGIASVGSYYLVCRVFAPLTALTEQAEAIANQDFSIIDNLPKTPEVRQVIAAMNSLALKLKQVFVEQAEFANQLQHEISYDQVTGLENRRAFENLLNHLVNEPDELSHGYLFMFEIAGLKTFNGKYGYAAGDELIREYAKKLKELCAQMPILIIAHLSGSYFTVLSNEIDEAQVKKSCDYILSQLRDVLRSYDENLCTHAGIALYFTGLTLDKLLAASDTALREAQAQAPFSWKMYRYTPSLMEGAKQAQDWRQVIQHILDNDTVFLSGQSCCIANQDQRVHQEIFFRASDPENVMFSAGQILPFAERFNLAIDIDKKMLSALLEYMNQNSVDKQDDNQQQNDKQQFVINLSQSSLCSSHFLEWVIALLHHKPAQAKRLTFEMVDSHVFTHLTAVKILTQRLKKIGCHFGVDHFGRHYSAFPYLASIGLDYIKLDGSYSRNIHFNQDNQFYIRAVVHAAHSLGVKVYATHVENAQQWHILKSLGVDGGQGQFLSPSVLLPRSRIL